MPYSLNPALLPIILTYITPSLLIHWPTWHTFAEHNTKTKTIQRTVHTRMQNPNSQPSKLIQNPNQWQPTLIICTFLYNSKHAFSSNPQHPVSTQKVKCSSYSTARSKFMGSNTVRCLSDVLLPNTSPKLTHTGGANKRSLRDPTTSQPTQACGNFSKVNGNTRVVPHITKVTAIKVNANDGYGIEPRGERSRNQV